jgi:predicted N-formylglutamate amidohydrolase
VKPATIPMAAGSTDRYHGGVMDVMPAGNSGESPPFEIVPGDPARGFVLTCDHALNRLPPRYGTLGLGPEALERHIAFDPGARAVTLALAARLGAPAVLSTFSRLLIDPNRGRDDPTLVMRLSDRAVIPATSPSTPPNGRSASRATTRPMTTRSPARSRRRWHPA